MDGQKEFHVNRESIRPLLGSEDTQIIFQRHCNYDRVQGGLIEESIETQKDVIRSFIEHIKESLSLEELKDTYFLFAASNTESSNGFKRCVETTDIAMHMIEEFLRQNGISSSNIININESANYNGVHQDRHLTEPKMFTDNTGYLDFLKEKHDGITRDFWIDFEEDLSKDIREQLNAEGPDEIVKRSERYIQVLQRYSSLFHEKKPNSRLIIWSGTHYDVISPLVKQRILNYEKSDIVGVDYCGGISLLLKPDGSITANVNGVNCPFDLQDNLQPQRHF